MKIQTCLCGRGTGSIFSAGLCLYFCALQFQIIRKSRRQWEVDALFHLRLFHSVQCLDPASAPGSLDTGFLRMEEFVSGDMHPARQESHKPSFRLCLSAAAGKGLRCQSGRSPISFSSFSMGSCDSSVCLYSDSRPWRSR